MGNIPPLKLIQPASKASRLAKGQNAKIGLGQFLGRTLLEMCFLRLVATIKIGLRTRVDAYVCLALHAGRVKRVKRVKRPILGQNQD